MSELIVINPTTDLEDLERQKHMYDALPVRLKMRSNDKCVSINGINNEELYNILKANILRNQESEDEYNFKDVDDISTTTESYINKMKSILSYNETTDIVESVAMDKIINKEERKFGLELNVPPITPFFTLSELAELTDSKFLEEYSFAYPSGLYNFDYRDNLYKVKFLYEKYKENPTEKLEDDIISLGWNPSVEPNDINIKKAHDRICKDIKNSYNIEVIDIRDLDVNESYVTSGNNDELIPIFIVISYSHSPLAKIINGIKHTKYAHATLSLDTKMDKLYTFNQEGFVIESLKKFSWLSDKATVKIVCTFVDRYSYSKIVNSLDYYISNKRKTTYSWKNVFRTLTGVSVKDKFSLSMICSEFVDFIMKMANISMFNDKSSNQIIPGDFDIEHDTDKFYIIYEGLCTEYDQKKADRLVKALLDKKSVERKKLQLKEAIDLISNHKDISLYKSIAIDDFEADIVYEEFINLLTPNAVISEADLFLKFDKKGNMKLELPMDFQSAYSQSHKLLLEYDKVDNINGMKEELCKLWYINTKIEKKLNSKFRKSKKELLDIRARVLNDFKKYLSKILSIESNFSFGNYYRNSKYYDSNISIDKNTLKWSGKLLKSIIL